MNISDILAILSGGAVGLVLALIGGGGSILATPALLYVVGVANPHVAIGTSAVAVSVNAFANLINHARRGNVKWRCAMVFAVSGVIGAAIGAAVGKVTDAGILLPLFALLMIVVGVFMLRPRKEDARADVVLTAQSTPKLVGFGLGAGALSGFFGIGGGFLIVPGLIAATGMPILFAVGSSLVAVTAFGVTTAVNYAFSGWVDWILAATFIGGGGVGGWFGARLAARLSARRGLLNVGPATLILVVGVYTLYRSVRALGVL